MPEKKGKWEGYVWVQSHPREEKKDTKIHVHDKTTENIRGTEKTKIKMHKWIANHRET